MTQLNAIITGDFKSLKLEDTLKDLIDMLVNEQVQSVVITDAEGHLVNVVSAIDIIRLSDRDLFSTYATIKDTLPLGKTIHFLKDDQDSDTARLLFMENNIIVLPVTNGENKVIGILTRDLLLKDYISNKI